jgi:hypothetical protein
MNSPEDIKLWLKKECPTIWSLLNKKAQLSLPKGITEYLCEGGISQKDIGRKNLEFAEKNLTDLVTRCGFNKVGDTYRQCR